jgi:WD40 repeat protein
MRALLALSLLCAACLHAAPANPLSIAPLDRKAAVNFEDEILPFLKQNCLACHNETKAKADLILETPQSILKGGESGPAVVPGKPDESLLMKAASHREKPFMPPAENKVNASDLNPQQLALLKLWIEQGASGEVHGEHSIAWRALPGKVRPILSLALTEDAQFAACGRGNELYLYQLPTGRTIGPLVDPAIASSAKAAHLDLVQSLDFSPDGELLASGSYREVKLWRRQHNVAVKRPVTADDRFEPTSCAASHLMVSARGQEVRIFDRDSGEVVKAFTNETSVVALAISPDAKKLAVAGEDRTVRLLNMEDVKVIGELKGDYRFAYRASQLRRASARAAEHGSYRKTMLEKGEKERQAQVERVRKASEAVGLVQKSLSEQQSSVNGAKTEEGAVQKELTTVQTKLKEAEEKAKAAEGELAKAKAATKTAGQELLETKLDELVVRAASAALASNFFATLKPETEKNEKAVQEKLKAAQKKVADGEAALKRLQITNSTAENELHFAIAAAQKAAEDVTQAQNELQVAEGDRKQLEMQLGATLGAFTNSFATSRALAFSRDGLMLAAATDGGTVTLWSSDSGAALDTIDIGYDATGVRFSEEGLLLTWNEGRASAWDPTATWKLERVITTANGQPAFADRVNAVRFSPDGQFLATGGGEPSRSGEIKIWRVRDGQLVQEFKGIHSDAVLAVAYSPDGRFLASGAADRFAKITEAATGKLVRVLEGHTHHVLALSWKADGHTLITGGADNLIKIWDVFSGEKKKSPEALTKEVTALAFIGETDQMLASSGDATLRIIKENGEKVRTFEGTSGYLEAAAAAADGSVVIAGGQDGVLRAWRISDGKLLSEYSTPQQ